ncbi:MAG TPA: orotidine-5'-phosphate decarboxylase [candidate division Zixibacteria bacterium]|nr:orotidine-5'-phosphate decarboxylase [candidate division Zixibacteria bacterium]MDD4918269.1 orotidine-5'-phosphate decarboxylase [candidate division Zixibacteria bacterium]MDM7973168.1 orotidine-5'-phosphate decarboxylase [candidate division Zixibacteria bacterium]HOD65848.1 orotidine-5'-phosphate decarboxylase [candidate division Zixibacteria bacterium]HOZ07462.1 orotidine-5'-phosphate decarboxylase [candidate division Zixibacteria bacterium]
MTALDKLLKAQSKNRSLVCLGLDLDPKKMPPEYSKSAKTMFDFTMRIFEVTADCVCAYKPNIAFYESLGGEGVSLLMQIMHRIPEGIPVILDAKRGDIGNTATHYAQALYDRYNADWVTLNPYMGYDSLRPFIERKDKGAFILCLTSNTGARDFQMLEIDGKPLYRIVAEKVEYWNKSRNCGLVVGATLPEQLAEIRRAAGDMPILIPGVGAQGGSVELAAVNGTDNFQKPAVINVSRSVLYASSGSDFAQKAREEVLKLNQAVNALRTGKKSEPLQPPPLPPRDSAPPPPEPPAAPPASPEPTQP